MQSLRLSESLYVLRHSVEDLLVEHAGHYGVVQYAYHVWINLSLTH